MDVKLENLIERLKQEGVEGAQKLSDEMLEKAKQESETIVQDAEKKAQRFIEDAEKQAARFQENTELAIKQAVRDAELQFKENIVALFDRVFKQDVAETLDPEFLAKLIASVLEKWAETSDAEILLPQKDLASLEKLLLQGLKNEAAKSIEIKAGRDLDSGFRIGLKGENVYYDFSDDTISEMLIQFLNPKIQALLEPKNG